MGWNDGVRIGSGDDFALRCQCPLLSSSGHAFKRLAEHSSAALLCQARCAIGTPIINHYDLIGAWIILVLKGCQTAGQ